ncbi:MAG: hypothetical protein ACI8PZ_001917 [Myxococcota bacterium]
MRTFIAALLLTLAPSALAETADEIMDKARETRQVESAVQKVRMVIVGKTGSERTREMEIKLKRDGDTTKTLFRFESPADVAGTSFLQIDGPDTDEQMLYMPALKRLSRISGSSRKGPFMGSDFSYEDLDLGEPGDATHKVVEEAGDSWVIDTDPGDASSYGRLRSTVDKSTYLAKRVEFFDDGGTLLKTLEVTETAQNGDKHVAKVSIMTTVKKGTSTRLEVIEQKFDVPAEELPDDIFTQAHLERGG